MAEETKSGGNAGLAFIVGALVVIVAVLAFMMFSGGFTQKKTVDVDISASAPKLPDAPKVPEAPKAPG
ncbi:hypothetical protein DMC25_23525 [Caulobacter sp. D4A]|uniref:hypothetical protein n=1 Tax=unclassified Caulobacter TaxID=2648921 RepID=UPI000D73C11C|nr:MULTISPECIES: hypothetical protein [unclassified Caulobacter]PXA77126.1 hypothetical protein DMC25_23525 [Caulobacter sp. D4A]PXA87755.1 hypothetical protein DMC18_20245 [Caulobacter sp. D5]